MGILRFERWCAIAVGRIRFKPDRKAVREELYAHMEDQMEELLAAGVPEGEAEREAAASMGDPQETAAWLEKVYRPFWGYALRVARWCLLVSAVLALFTLPGFFRELNIHDPGLQVNAYFGEDREDEYGIDRRTYYAEPGVRARSDGYTFTVTRVAERRRISKYEGVDDSEDFYIQVEVFDPWPWAEQSDILREFTAVDSLGNVYAAFNHSPARTDTPTLSGNPSRTGIFTCTWTLWLWGYHSREAEWIELRYQKSGRDIRLPIDLRGRKGAET